MKDGTPTILYTKETREVCNLLCVHRACRAAEQQSNRALCRSRDTTLCCLGSWSRRTSSLSDLLPEALSQSAEQRPDLAGHLSRRGPDNPLVTWLEERGAQLKTKDALLEQLCLECPPNVATLNWIDGFSTHSCDQTWQTLRTVFKSKARQAEWLLQKEARIKPRAVLLLLVQGNHGGGDDRVASYAMACRQDDFEHVLLTRGVGIW
jgi:hypothetical protein